MGVLPVIIHFYLGFSIRKKREGKISPIVWDIRSYHLFCVNGFSMKETIIFGIFINIYIVIIHFCGWRFSMKETGRKITIFCWGYSEIIYF